jgi:GT2 family glycosyltransferase
MSELGRPSAGSPRVAVVIPNWNGLTHLPECLEALSAQRFSDFEVLLVDNDSRDASVEWTREHFPDARIIQRPKNGGFSRAVNEGIRTSEAEYVALLNNDTAADPGWLGALVRALDTTTYDFAASLMVPYEDPTRVNAAGDVYRLWRLAGRNRGLGRPVQQYSRPMRVLGACAGAALYRRSLFSEVGLFDEAFFLTSEDTDFNLRCLIAGKRCLYVPNARVRHKLGASIRERPHAQMRRLQERNEGVVAAKDLPLGVVLFVPLIWALFLMPEVLWTTFRDTVPLRPQNWHKIPSLVRESMREHPRFHFWEGFRDGLSRRREVWARSRASGPEIVRWLLVGSAPAHEPEARRFASAPTPSRAH